MPKPIKPEYTKREVIEDKLLAAITDEGKAAILATEDDLKLMVTAFRLAEQHANGVGNYERERKFYQYGQDLQTLLNSSFLCKGG